MGIRPWVLGQEKLVTYWDSKLRSDSAVKYYNITYESILLFGRPALFSAISFLLGCFTLDELVWHSDMHQVHESGCSVRIEDYSQVKKVLHGTRSYWACEVLHGH